MLIDGHETRRAPSNIFLGMYHSRPTPINQQKTAQHIFLSSNSAFFYLIKIKHTHLITTYIVCGLQKFQSRWFLVFFTLSLFHRASRAFFSIHLKSTTTKTSEKCVVIKKDYDA